MRTPIPSDVREAVLARHGGRCAYCLKYTQSLHLDHIYPVGRGGLNVARNLVVACAKCNLAKHARIPRNDMDLPHVRIPCEDCGSPFTPFYGRSVLFPNGLFGWCIRCSEMREELGSWDDLQIENDLGIEEIAA